MRFLNKQKISIRILKEPNLFLGEKSDPLISYGFVRIKLQFKLFPSGEINNFSHHPLAHLFHSFGIHHFSIFPDSILIALEPSRDPNETIKDLWYIILSLKKRA